MLHNVYLMRHNAAGTEEVGAGEAARDGVRLAALAARARR
jgi:hypothetical protein